MSAVTEVREGSPDAVVSGRVDSLRVLEQEVGVLIRRVKRVIGERANAVHPDLQGASYLMLGFLAEHEPMRASALCEVFHVDKGAISRQVQHLVDLGLVDRTADPDDGRASLVTASAHGRRRLEEVADLRRAWLDERLGEWSDDDLSAFAANLSRYNAALTQPADLGG